MNKMLHPILLSDLDKKNYLLVKTVKMIRSLQACKNYSQEFPDEAFFDIKNLSSELRHSFAYLVFPALHERFRLFPQEILQHSAVIAVYDRQRDRMFVDGHRNEYFLSRFFTLDLVGENDNRHLLLKEHPGVESDYCLPIFPYNDNALLESLDAVLDFFRSNGMEGSEWFKRLTFRRNGMEGSKWFKRLTSARKEFVDCENGLQLLHNLGFFDHGSLLQAMQAKGGFGGNAAAIFAAYYDSLKVFAMAEVNSSACRVGSMHRYVSLKKSISYCDYAVENNMSNQLFPLDEEHFDKLLYHTVKHLVAHPEFRDFYDHSDVRNKTISFEKQNPEVTWSRPNLVFPSDEPSIAYSEAELKQPFIVAIFSEYDEYYAGEAGLIDEGDVCPVFRDYLIVEYFNLEGDSTPHVGYRWSSCGEERSLPKVFDNTNDFKQALEVLHSCLNGFNVPALQYWKERIQTARKMIDSKSDKLHILHNAGLYDIKALWLLLVANGLGVDRLRVLSRRVERELHRYAMFAINGRQ